MEFSKEQLNQIKKDVSFLFDTKISSYEEKLVRLSILEKFNQEKTWSNAPSGAFYLSIHFSNRLSGWSAFAKKLP